MSTPFRSQDARRNGRIGGLTYAANTSPDELRARGRHAFAARMARLEALADPTGALPPSIRWKRAERLLRLEMTRLAARRWRRHRARPIPERPAPEQLGQFGTGERNPASRHPDATVLQARELYDRGWNLRRIADEVGADYGTVGRWCRGETRSSAQEPIG